MSGSGATYYDEEINPALEEVVTVLRDHITGNGGSNILLTLWVDDLTNTAVSAIRAAGDPLPRQMQTTAAKRLFEDKGVVEHAKTKQKKDEKADKEAEKKRVAEAKKRTEQGAMNWSFADLEDDPPPAVPTGNEQDPGVE
ncbi:hypothetical protein B0H10DRAFT_2226844 [Mycena sp. CBHHK59/15]|nr:hypothetical protein B0H10DRAFT_2226844 [Mycena sp. CBHHK59/15]